MNLAVRRLFSFFFAIATLASCEDATDIGLDLQDENQIGSAFTDTLTVNTGTVLLNDSILSFKVTPVQVGQYSDPVLGSVRATTFAEVGLNGSDLKLGDNLTADSVVLTLDYSSIYGNTSAPLTLEVHRLTESFQDKQSYFTTSALAYENATLGAATIQPRLIKVKRNNTEVDSAVIARVKLNKAFADELVAQSGQSAFSDQASFSNFFKGVALVAVGEPSGNIVSFKLTSSSSKITLYYKAGTEQKTHVFNWTSGENFFTNVQADRTGTAVADLDEKGEYKPSSETGGDSFIQTNTQLLTKISFPNLKQFKEAQGNIIINRAELVIPVKKSSTTSLAPPPQLILYPTNNNNRILKNAAGIAVTVQKDLAYALNSTTYTAPLTYDAKRNNYTLNITSYVQAMLLGQKENNGLLLAPAKVADSGGSQGTTTVSPETAPYRAIISNTGEDKVKLLLYFSKLN